MKLQLNKNLKEIPVFNNKTSWQKALFWTFLISFVIFSFSNFYILFKPIDKNIEAIIQDEISSTNITFDKKTLETIRIRQEPATVTAPEIGKNPFSPF